MHAWTALLGHLLEKMKAASRIFTAPIDSCSTCDITCEHAVAPSQGQAWFGTRSSKSRLNFLDLLRAGHIDYVLSDAAYRYVRKHSLAAMLIARLAAEPETRFADRAAWLAHLDQPGFSGLDATPDPIRVATEGALWAAFNHIVISVRRCRAER